MSVATYSTPRGTMCNAPQQREGVLVRRPRRVVPGHRREEEVGRVVVRVPALLAGLLGPRVDLTPLLGDPREPVVEHLRHPVLDGEPAPAALAVQGVRAERELGRADRTAENFEQGRAHPRLMGR